MARQYKTGLIITGDASGGIKAVRATEKELAQLNQRFDRGSKRAQNFAQNTGGVSREMQVLRRLAAPVGAALAGMFAANSLRNQINFADQLQKTNLRIGASTEALSEYSHVANLAGVQFDQLTTAWQRQSRRIAQAAQDTGEAQEALAALNLDAAELAQLAPEDQFERIAEAMNGVASEAQRVALAQKIWDSEGVRLLQIVNQGTDAIRAQREEAERLGLTISQDTAEAMAGFNDEITRLQAVGTGLSRQILSELVPAMTSGMQATSEWIDEMGGAAEILDTTKDVAAALAAVLAGRLAGSLATATARMMATAGAAGALRGALALVGGPIGLLVGGAGLLYAFREELGLVGEQASNTARRLNQLTASMASMSATEIKTNLESARMEMKFLVDQGQNLREVLKGMGPGDVWDGRTYSELREQYNRLRDDAIAARDTVKELEGALSDASETVKVNVPPLEDLDDALGGVASGSSDATAASEGFASELDSLRRQLDPAYAASQRLAQSTALLDRGLATGALTLQEYLDLWDRAADVYIDAGRETEQLAVVTEETVDDMARTWERAEEDIDRAFSDAFAGAFDSFESFADQLQSAFERLLGELAYQATLRPIVVGFTSDMRGLMGIAGGAQGGGFGGTISGAQSVWNGLTGAFGGGSTAATYGGLYSTAATGIAQGGLYGNVATGGVAASGGLMSGLSSAMPWVGAGVLADNVLGLGIVDGVVSGVSSALGISGKYSGENPTGILVTRNEYGSAGREGWERDAYATGALGDVGFAPESRDIDTLFGDRDNFENAQRYAEQLAQMDNIVAQLATSEEELAEMRRVAAEQGLTDMGDLEGRYRAILGSLGDDFDAYVGTLDGELQEVIQQAVTAGQAFNVMSGATERLNLQFDAAGVAAYEAAASMAEMAGGVQNLASVQQGYYQAVFSETERLSHQVDDLKTSLSEVTDTVPTTTDELRAMVEGADLSTESGRELALSLMDLAPALAQTTQAVEQAITSAYQEHLGRAPEIEGFDYWVDRVQSGAVTLNEALEYIASSAEAAAGGMDATRMRIEIMRLEGREAAAAAEERRIELAYMEQSLRPLQQRIWALEDEAAAQAEAERRQQERNRALEQERRAMERAQEQLQAFSNRIEDWLAQLNATDKGMGTPQEQFASAQGDFASMLVRAEAGDRDALQSITQYADRYLSAAQGMYASGDAAQSVRDEIIAAMEGLPELLSAEQFLAQEIDASLGEQTDTLAAELQALRDQAEGIVEANAGGSQQLVEILQHEMGLLGDTVLTDAQIRSALAPHATDAEIDRLIGQVDANGDGMLSLQEATNARLDSMAGSIASAMEPLFDDIDLNADGLIDYSEFERIFSDVATDDELKRIYSRLDMDGDRQISKMEAIRQAAALGADNTEALAIADLLDGLPVSLARDHMPGAWQDMAYNIVQEFKAQGVEGFAKGGAFVGGVQAFASGGAFTNSVVSKPTTFPMGLMGEAGPEAIMPLSRTADGSLGVRAEVAPIMPEFPLLGGNDVAQVMRDLRSEVAQLRRELADSQQEIVDNTGQTRDAVAGVGRHAAQQREQQLSEQRAANRALRRQQRGQTV